MGFSRASAFLGLALLGLLSCESPSATFNAFPIQQPQNLEKKLGSRVCLISAQDTLNLQVQYDPVSKRNTFTQSGTQDTLLSAWALHHKQLYYLVEPHTNTTYWVHAVRIRSNEVQGLATGWQQMMDLSKVVKRGTFPELVQYQSSTNDSIQLRFNVRQLREFYSAEIDSFPVYRFASTVAGGSLPPTLAAPALYPNPAQQYATLSFAAAGKRTVQLFTTSGQCLYRTETDAATLTLPVAQLPAGQYTVRASGLADQKPTNLQLLISR
ncbi:T9SS type A sorting domain-containing protein [Hymenobacter wooponensis]|uniref:T9SS type A sorting domain-containing protein n=1 Tax=Hymenobacter wooponensis TaxID=1525360 RepID=A0A4Z0MP48_9BACT|nr:T9SS type A sorting domain-containing protein [Hymenobacter wooponensis]TGD81401.1 T9SS type A sorting domain-containing protein [Hymenobacter wooponensis]